MYQLNIVATFVPTFFIRNATTPRGKNTGGIMTEREETQVPRSELLFPPTRLESVLVGVGYAGLLLLLMYGVWHLFRP